MLAGPKRAVVFSVGSVTMRPKCKSFLIASFCATCRMVASLESSPKITLCVCVCLCVLELGARRNVKSWQTFGVCVGKLFGLELNRFTHTHTDTDKHETLHPLAGGRTRMRTILCLCSMGKSRPSASANWIVFWAAKQALGAA